MKKQTWAVIAALGMLTGSTWADNVALNDDFSAWEPAKPVTGIVFADGKMATDWKIGSSLKTGVAATVSAEAIPGKDDEKALKIDKTDASSTVEINQYLLTVKPNATYKFSFKLKAIPAADGKISLMYVVQTGAAKTFWGNKKGVFAKITEAVPEWKEIKQTIKTGADSDRAIIRFWLQAGTKGVVQLTDVELEAED